jgi:hypothetical protein
MSQGHLVLFCSNAGIPASPRAAMLSVLLGRPSSAASSGAKSPAGWRFADDPCWLGTCQINAMIVFC